MDDRHRKVSGFFDYMAAVMGIIFALLVEATGSMYSSMLAHFAANSYSVILMQLVSMTSGGSELLEQSAQAAESSMNSVPVIIAQLLTVVRHFFSSRILYLDYYVFYAWGRLFFRHSLPQPVCVSGTAAPASGSAPLIRYAFNFSP